MILTRPPATVWVKGINTPGFPNCHWMISPVSIKWLYKLMQCRIYLSIDVSIRLSFYLSVYLSILLSFFVSSFLSNSVSVSLSVCVTNTHQHTCIMHVYIYYYLFIIHSFIHLFIYLFIIYLLSLSLLVCAKGCNMKQNATSFMRPFSIRKLSCCADQTMFLAESCDANESAVFFLWLFIAPLTIHPAVQVQDCDGGWVECRHRSSERIDHLPGRGRGRDGRDGCVLKRNEALDYLELCDMKRENYINYHWIIGEVYSTETFLDWFQ